MRIHNGQLVVTANKVAPEIACDLGSASSPYSNVVARSYAFLNGATNCVVSGFFYRDSTVYTNLNGASTLTNLGAVTLPVCLLTNKNDVLTGYWSGTMANATANTNGFRLCYGAAGTTILLDTGLQIVSNSTFVATVKMMRTGASAQTVDANIAFFLGSGGVVPYAATNIHQNFTFDNGPANILCLRSQARIGGAHTNDFFEACYCPATK